ncbi:MAG TPA: hypothetical protein VL576_03795 [Candidatus Paceibacterota bacterium]|jgi:hypothetical protein|nr:hypothetical protein [Candidatus Paceibacterota bacterium]
MLRKIISLSLIIAILFLPAGITVAYAQSASCSAITSSNYSTCCPSTIDPNSATGQLCTAYFYANIASGLSGTINSGNSATPTTGLTGGQKYTPQVQLQFGSNGSFGGLTFKGVGSALLACSGFGTFLGNAVGKVVNAAKKAVITGLKTAGATVLGVAEAVPYVGPFIKGIAGAFSSSKPKPGDSADKPLHTKDDALEQKAACLDGIAYVLSQQVLQQITNRTLRWANTGFGGNPLYIRDIDSYLLSVRNQQISSFLQSEQNSDPIFGNALRSIITLQTTGRSDGLLRTSPNTPQAQSYNSFISNFSNGGWDALLNPSYNPVGALLNANGTLTYNISKAQNNTQNEIQRNAGYLDMKTCVQYANNGQVGNSTQNGSGLSSSNTPTCLKYETVTPGSLVAAQVANITNSPTRQAELATQFNEAVGAFFDSLLNQLFSRGLSGVKGQANQADLGLSYGGLGSNTVLDSNGNALAGVNDNVGYINDIAAKSSGTVDISHPQLLRTIIKIQYDYVNRATDAATVLDRLVPELGKLDYCLPGPNPSWQDGLSDNFAAYIAGANIHDLFVNGTVSNSGLSLYDSFSGNNVPIGDRTLTVVGTNSVKNFLQTVENQLSADLTNKFNINTLANAYAATTIGEANQVYARGMAIDAYNEVGGLAATASSAVSTDQNYVDRINSVQSDIAQLQVIDSQVEQIVAAAKTRYEAAQKAAGTPVNQQCLDNAYSISTTAITGTPRQESDVPNPIIQQSIDASSYFYSNL